MSHPDTAPATLLGLFAPIPGDRTAVILREENIRVTYAIEAVVGAVVELGERLGVAMPATRAVYACTKLLDEPRAQRIVPTIQEVAR